jgi:type III restriction enzyme
LAAYSAQILKLVDSVFSDSQIPLPQDDRKTKRNHLNSNFQKTEFQALWNRIHRKAVYAVRFESEELIGKCIAALDAELRVTAAPPSAASAKRSSA